MKLMAFALTAAVASSASATFVQYVVTKTQTSNSGIQLDVYTVWARFNGSTDTVLNAFNFNRTDSNVTNIFYHKDNDSSNGGVLQKAFGTWSPTATGNATTNRPFDSYLVIGGLPTGLNSTSADPSRFQPRRSERPECRLVQRQPAEQPGSRRLRRQHGDRCPPRSVLDRPRHLRWHLEPEDRLHRRRLDECPLR